MRYQLVVCLAMMFFGPWSVAVQAAAPLSEATRECIDCHASVTPGIVGDWRSGRHAAMTVATALAGQKNTRRISATDIPARLSKVAVGCAECHTLRPGRHADTFEHNGYDVHVVVSPRDCAVCHAKEDAQYAQNLMSHAYGNLHDNTLYRQLQVSVIGDAQLENRVLTFRPAGEKTRAEACYSCHGTRLTFQGLETRETDAGEMVFPKIGGWPSQGVGRINLDGSRGACTACHTRHAFAIEMARKPATCRQCHVGPDVPAFKIYAASKHGGLYAALGGHWDFSAVPWIVGRDFSAPTCAACHVSLLADGDGEVIAPRTHRMNDRLPWRIYGLVYAHPHPKKADTRIIRNREGLPLPTSLDGEPASAFLIGALQQEKRRQAMQAVCRGCHSTSWVNGHWKRFENTIRQTNASVRLSATFMQRIWRSGAAHGLAAGVNPFDEAVEKAWTEGWLFFANSTRFAAAMAGGGDYGVFANGRFQLSRRLSELAARANAAARCKP